MHVAVERHFGRCSTIGRHRDPPRSLASKRSGTQHRPPSTALDALHAAVAAQRLPCGQKIGTAGRQGADGHPHRIATGARETMSAARSIASPGSIGRRTATRSCSPRPTRTTGACLAPRRVGLARPRRAPPQGFDGPEHVFQVGASGPAVGVPGAAESRSAAAQPARPAHDRSSGAKPRSRGRRELLTRRGCDTHRPGRHRQDAPGLQVAAELARRVSRTASTSSRSRRSPIPTWWRPRSPQALGAAGDADDRSIDCVRRTSRDATAPAGARQLRAGLPGPPSSPTAGCALPGPRRAGDQPGAAAHLPGEQEYPVPPLALPAPRTPPTRRRASPAEAVAAVRRARAGGPARLRADRTTTRRPWPRSAPARRPAPGDRAGGGAHPAASPDALLARLDDRLGPADRRRARPARAPADAARHDRLELRPARPSGAGAVSAAASSWAAARRGGARRCARPPGTAQRDVAGRAGAGRPEPAAQEGGAAARRAS